MGKLIHRVEAQNPHKIPANMSLRRLSRVVNTAPRITSAFFGKTRYFSKPTAASASYFPYGVSDWEKIKTRGSFYVDKTMYINELEKSGDYLKIWRPPRFGKSLFCQQLSLYYDKHVDSQKFQELFKDTAIGNCPTAERGRYMVLFFSFNEVSKMNLYERFNDYVNTVVENFILKYGINVTINPKNCNDSLSRLFHAAERQNGEIYIIVDEVDSFINSMLVDIQAGDGDAGSLHYDKMIASTASTASNLIRNWGNVVKAGTNNVVKRMFITGIAPIALADGMNLVKDVTFNPQFAGMFGFTQSDMERALQDCFEMKGWKQNDENYLDYSKHLNMMKTYYDGYHFTDEQEESMYNPQSCYYHLQNLFETGKPPQVMMDRNLSDGGNSLVSFLLNHRDRLKAYSIIGLLHTEVVQTVPPHFSISMLLDDDKAEEAMVSFAFFSGYFTYKVTRNEKNEIIPSTTLCVSNKVHYDHYLSGVPTKEIEKAVEARLQRLGLRL